jgi:hypothetical protein
MKVKKYYKFRCKYDDRGNINKSAKTTYICVISNTADGGLKRAIRAVFGHEYVNELVNDGNFDCMNEHGMLLPEHYDDLYRKYSRKITEVSEEFVKQKDGFEVEIRDHRHPFEDHK